ncbi:MAG: ribonuclease HII, partial [Treponema sp.]|nr:ribonuclease HII [Treponema sp.]
KYPEYGYAKHKGYPTRDHMEICRKIGPSPIQRKSFKY